MLLQLDDYRKAFAASIMLHLLLLFMLLFESTNSRPVLTPATQTTSMSQQTPINIEPKNETIKAVSIDNHEVMETVNRLKEERIQQQRAEEMRQQKLQEQAALAKKQRMAEQRRLERLKEEAAKDALARDKKLKEQEKQLAEMKKQQLQLEKQQQEAVRLAELQKKKAAELERIKQANEAKAKAELEQKQRAEAQQAAITAQKNAQIAGVVDKYKALIINAISRQWILPDNANSNLSSQFRIRLAPNGSVLEVHLTRSSGDSVLDRSAQSAIYKASPLPVPSDPETFNLFRDISLTVRPENVRG